MGTVIIALVLSAVCAYFEKLDFLTLFSIISLALELHKGSPKYLRMIKKGYRKIRKMILVHRPIKVHLNFELHLSFKPHLRLKVHLSF